MTQSVLEHSDGAAAGSTTNWTRRLFAPIATLVLVLLIAWWIDSRLNIDLLTAAQNDRLTFQTEGASEVAGLKAAEIASASSVLQRDRAIADGKVQVLYLGNSQTLAIMDRQAGDLTSPQWLQVLLARSGANGEVRLGSLPNMSTSEMLLQLLANAEARPKPLCNAVVISLVLEEFRGVGIREEMQDLVHRPDIHAHLQQLLAANVDLPAARQTVADLLAPRTDVHAADVASDNKTWTDRTDEHLGALAERLPYLDKRDQVTGFVGVTYMTVRNKLLGITSSSARPVPEPTYRASAEVLELLLRYAKQRDIPVLIYLAPIRPIQPNPNLPADVERFRRDIPQICAKYGVACLDFIDLVPESLWTNYPDGGGPTGGQRDFAHFTGAAHKLVAETMLPHAKAIVGRANVDHKQVSAR